MEEEEEQSEKKESQERREKKRELTSKKNLKIKKYIKKSNPSAVCLKSEKDFENEKGLVLKEFNHDKPSGKVSWKAEKAGEYYFTDPEKCGRGVEVTVVVADPAKSSRKMK